MTDCPQCDDDHPRGSAKCPGRRVGKTVAGRYKIVKLLGVGGAGAVYEAERIEGGELVALKMLRKELSKNKGLAERFQREALSAAAVAHPGVVRVGSLGEDSDGCLFLEMEILRGMTLDELMRAGPVPVERAVALMVQVLDALAAAHACGIIHRDIKPENIFLAREGDREVVKVLDLGIAKVTAQQRMTKTGELLGTPLYMSPEQMRSSTKVDARGDVYSVGAILFELLTQQRVIRGAMFEVMAMVVQGKIKRNPREVRTDVPEWLDRAVARALAFSPDERFPSAKEMKTALEDGGASFWRKLWPFRAKA